MYTKKLLRSEYETGVTLKKYRSQYFPSFCFKSDKTIIEKFRVFLVIFILFCITLSKFNYLFSVWDECFVLFFNEL